MNERIKELMRQSMVEYQFDLRFSPEKFAELLIQECRNAISDLDVDSPEATIALLMADGAIRSRFGVS